MNITFRVHNPDGVWLRTLDGKSTSQAWLNLRNRLAMPSGNVAVQNESLRQQGWRVKRHLDVSDTEEMIAVTVAETVIGEKKVGLIRNMHTRGHLFGWHDMRICCSCRDYTLTMLCRLRVEMTTRNPLIKQLCEHSHAIESAWYQYHNSDTQTRGIVIIL
jgi:hypothetical protein